MIALPAYIDKEAWQGFCDMRKTIKKPLTFRAAKMILVQLQKLKDLGHDPNAALDQSTNHCWADVYMPKECVFEPAKRQEAEKTAQYLAEHTRERDPQASERLAEIRQKLRRVA